MAINDDNAPSKLNGLGTSAQRGVDGSNVLSADLRSIVERQFTLMEQAHDRIRAEELTVRLSERIANLAPITSIKTMI